MAIHVDQELRELTPAVCAARSAAMLDMAATSASPEFAHAITDIARAWIDLGLQLDDRVSFRPPEPTVITLQTDTIDDIRAIVRHEIARGAARNAASIFGKA